MTEPGTLNYNYAPRIVGVGPPIESARSGKVYEFMAIGRDEPGTLSKLNGVLNAHRVKVVSAGGYSVPEPGSFVWSGFADYSVSQFKVEQTLEEIRKLDFVFQCQAIQITDVLFDKFLFPVTILGKSRVIIVRAEPFIGVEQRLIKAFGSAGATIMFDEGRQYCLEVFPQYLKMLPGATPEVILKNAVAGLRTTGWGIFEFDVSRLLVHGQATVAIREPPFSGIAGVKESYFTNGLACGAIETIFNAKVRVETSRYDEKTRTLYLTLKSIGGTLA